MDNLYFCGHPVEVRVYSPFFGFISISLVSFDDLKKEKLPLTVKDNFSHAFDLVKELLKFYES